MKHYQKGTMEKGIVTGIENYGIFLSFEDGFTGLIHISELSDHFVKDVSEYACIGEEVLCFIIDCDLLNKKLKCSIRNTDFGRAKDQNIDHGFAPLKRQLPIWMEEKLKDMQENLEK